MATRSAGSCAMLRKIPSQSGARRNPILMSELIDVPVSTASTDCFYFLSAQSFRLRNGSVSSTSPFLIKRHLNENVAIFCVITWYHSPAARKVSTEKWEKQEEVAVRKTDSRNLIFFSSSLLLVLLPSTIETYFHELWEDLWVGRGKMIVVSLGNKGECVWCERRWMVESRHSRTRSWWFFMASGSKSGVQHWILWFVTFSLGRYLVGWIRWLGVVRDF